MEYRVTHKELYCKDDPKLKKNDDLKLDFWFLHSIEYFSWFTIMIQQRNTRNPEVKKNDVTNSAISSLKTHLCG